ncbi:hypothetical protein JCGZ_19803 [Jatropha curcas]|uniref:Uncharacterized protein n=1 Tax=Jatropha curcas TaxID=180498 RepID=A0A067JU70_JATCU|nr:hypothetical protein JCGZ_19803 [Jatropha curcas]
MGLVAGGRLAVWREAARAGRRAVDLLSLASHTEIDAGKKKREEKKREEKKRKKERRKGRKEEMVVVRWWAGGGAEMVAYELQDSGIKVPPATKKGNNGRGSGDRNSS